MDLKDLTWDYAEPLKDDAWQARRLAEFFPFVAEGLCREDKDLLLREIDNINLPDERKEIIRMVCSEKQNGNRILTKKQDQRFGIKGLNYVIPERLLMVKRMRAGELPVLLSDLDFDRLKTFFVKQSAALIGSRIGR